MTHDKSFKNISTILNHLSKNIGLDEFVKEENLFCEWDEIVGDSISKHCKPKCIEKKILFLEVENSFWKKIIVNQKKELLQLILNHFGNNFITKIIFL